MNKLTERQQEIYDFVIAYRLKKGYSPSMVDVAEEFDFSSANAAQCHVDAICEKGWMTKTYGVSRSLKPVVRPQTSDERMIQFFVAGEPVAKGRARHRNVKTKAGKQFVQTYTPKKTKNYESIVADAARYAMQTESKITGPCYLSVTAFFSVPESWSMWKRDAALQGRLSHTLKPDGDNVLKAVKDALNDIVWTDDSYVTESRIVKVYSDEPGVSITITPVKRIPAQVISKKDYLAQLDELAGD